MLQSLRGEIEMKLIERPEYLNRLEAVKGTPDIKVITGIRRSGKSKLLEAYIQQIRRNEISANIIHINFSDNKFEPLLEYHALLNYINNKYVENCDNYIFIDEVQMCSGFEKAVNSLHASEKYDIYITGSNAFLLSSDLATLFTGRTYEIAIYPFSFKEFVSYYELSDIQEAYRRYLLEGGMPGSYVYHVEKDKLQYISSVFDTLILRDIKQKYKVRNTDVLSKLSDYMTDNISNLTSSRKITEYMNTRGWKADHKTVGKYIDYLCKAFAFYKIRRYDMQGKKYLASSEKYYLADHSFKYAKLGTKNMDFGRSLENIVALELMRRQYELYVGILYKKEIDFVAIRGNEKIYIQVSNSIEEDATRERELAPLRSIKDAYPKIIITRTGYPEYDIDGIRVLDIADWLLQ